MTSTLKQELTERKTEVITFLQQAKIAKQSTNKAIAPAPRNGNLSLSFAQQRMWFNYQLDSNNPFYNESFQVRITGKLNIPALEKSINEIVRRHEALRTSFSNVEGKPLQYINPSLNVPLPVIDLQGSSEAEVQQIIIKEARQPFDLSNGSLLRTTLLHLAPESYVLILVMHHIITDGASMGVFFQELSAFYQDAKRTDATFTDGTYKDAISTDATCRDVACNVSTRLPELPIQYADFAIWQRQWLTGEVLERQLNYWKQQLASVPPLLELPTDKPRPPVQTYCGAIAQFQLDQNLTQQLQTLSQKSRTTLFMSLLAAYSILLYRYSGQEDICIGSPFANRNRQEVESLIGFFANTIVLRTQIKDNPSFSELLQQVRRVVLDAHTHQDIPFEQVVEALQPQRSPSYNPLFQTMFVLENFSIDTLDLPDISLTPQLVDRGTSQFDLSLSMWETEAGLRGYWEYNTDLFESDTIARMTGHFQTLLSAIVANPQLQISELPILTENEQHQLLIEWNSKKSDFPKDKCIHQLFESQVEKTPDAVAVEFGSQKLTYAQLNAKANQLAHYLQTLGVEPEVLVGLCIERSLEMVVGLLGILKAGGAYVPLDPNYPPERLGYMLADSGVSILLTQQKLVDVLPKNSAKVICLDKDPISTDITCNVSTKVSKVKSDNLAYIIYTSGSTGKPKGVMIEHRSLVNFIEAAKVEYGISSEDKVLQFASISFDVAAEEIYTCLTAGGTLVLRTDEMINSTSQFLQSCRESQLTVLDLPTAYWHQLTSELVTTGEILPASVRLVIIGGEAALAETLNLWRKYGENKLTQTPLLINAYGPTEATVETTTYRFSELRSPHNINSQLPIGRPLKNVEVYILDKYLQPVPIGVPGELYIGGAGLARGYFNRPELTAEKFIQNSFLKSRGAEEAKRDINYKLLPITGSKLYKTGDLVRYLPDGNIEFLGRIDNQVKIRGFRIELGEIETAIAAHPQIKEAVVIVQEDEPGKKRLVAYIVETLNVTSTSLQTQKSVLESLGGRKSTPPTFRNIQNTLRDFLKQKLPDYMVPSVFVILDSLPLTPSGKVDRRALPIPSVNIDLENFVAPRNYTEEILADIWKNVLNLKQVGIHNNFFELGGDSIVSIQIIARAHQAGLKLTPKQLFQYQTVAELAMVAGKATTNLQAQQGLVTGEIPLTPIQHWFFEQNFVEPHHFNQAMLLEVPSDIKPELLQQGLKQLLVHHDALRLQYVQHSSQWEQINRDATFSVPFQVIDLSHLESEEEKIAFITQKANEQQKALNISTGQLVQMVLFQSGTSLPGRLLIVIHHLAVDGVSWRILLEDLTTAYYQLLRGENIQLPAKTTSFKDWSYRLQDYAQGEALRSELKYWLQMTNTFATHLPVDYTHEKSTEKFFNTVASCDIVSVFLSREQTHKLLQEIPSVYNTQINDVLLTALVQTFAQWTDGNSLLVDLEGHGREDLFEDVDLSRTVGWFTSVFPVLLKLEDLTHLGDILKSVKEQLRQIPQRGIGYGILRYLSPDLNIREQLQTLPQAEISFNYLGQFDQTQLGNGWKFARESHGEIHSPLGQRSHLLEIDGLIINGQLQLDWRYSKNIHEKSTVEGLANCYLQALETIIAHCLSNDAGGYTPSDFPEADLSQDELDVLLSLLD
ncbi:non-ribosomal peptide synthetase [Mastigocoleus testarum BC008]|uniref:Non-ribosomal peptide synthetase n=2 Tax=Mastigocoleus TaxID=996924 RepID=A0A0V7ZVI7_9CYAN|nr:non-ribosomal peptide synthetase [Mastigocoleus testarum BC008]